MNELNLYRENQTENVNRAIIENTNELELEFEKNNVQSSSSEEQRMKHLLSLKCNEVCADCDQTRPTWASTNIGIFICINCSGCHRQMGTHVSKVKSTTLDRWSHGELDHMEQCGGNWRVNRSIYNYTVFGHTIETTLSDDRKDGMEEEQKRSIMDAVNRTCRVTSDCTREDRMKFIAKKYERYHEMMKQRSEHQSTSAAEKVEAEGVDLLNQGEGNDMNQLYSTPIQKRIDANSLAEEDESFVIDDHLDLTSPYGVLSNCTPLSHSNKKCTLPSSNSNSGSGSSSSNSASKDRGLISRAKSFVEKRRDRHRRSQSSTEIGMIEFQGILIVHLLRGRSLSARDPYCKLWTGPNIDNPMDLYHGQLMRSKTVKKCSNPEWNETLTCCVCNVETDVLFLKCKDADRVSIKNGMYNGKRNHKSFFVLASNLKTCCECIN